jgi:hypothetical protein
VGQRPTAHILSETRRAFNNPQFAILNLESSILNHYLPVSARMRSRDWLMRSWSCDSAMTRL